MKLSIIAFILFAVLVLSSCTAYYRISQDYKGKPVEKVTREMGKPTSVENLSNGMVLQTYQKSKLLSAAPINTGQFRYDSFESPKSVKTETFLFYVDSSGVVKDVKYECTYNR